MTDDPQVASPGAAALSEVVYLHEPYWHGGQGDWLKSLLLFFDGVALLVPDYMRDRPLLTDPSLAQPLDEQGLLHRLSPETLVDTSAAEQLTEILDQLINTGSFDDLSREADMVAISYSRLGGLGSRDMTNYVINALQERGLAGKSTDGVSIPLHASIRALVLAILLQLIKTSAEAGGLALQPATARPELARALMAVLRIPIAASTGHVVASDLSEVAIDLSTIPLDEVLDFRSRHGDEYRRYARNLRRFLREVTGAPEADQHQAFADRRAELADEADRLTRLSRTAWHRPAGSFLLGSAGSAASFALGNPVGGAIAAASALFGLTRQADAGSAYTYLFRAQSELSDR